MGSYTQLKIDVKIKGDLPDDVCWALEMMVTKEDWSASDDRITFRGISYDLASFAIHFPVPKHALFAKSSWLPVLRGNSTYHPESLSKRSSFEFFDGAVRHLIACSSFKNYDDQIRLFLDWISPYIIANSGDVIGSIRYSGSDADDEVISFDGSRCFEVLLTHQS